MTTPETRLAIDQLGRYGMVEVHADGRIEMRRRRMPSIPSLWDQWLDVRWRRLPENTLRLFFNQPRRCPGFLVLAYAQAGPATTPETLRKGMAAIELIAARKNLFAIVCHATHPKLTDRVMRYFGYERHAMHLRGRHYIRRISG